MSINEQTYCLFPQTKLWNVAQNQPAVLSDRWSEINMACVVSNFLPFSYIQHNEFSSTHSWTPAGSLHTGNQLGKLQVTFFRQTINLWSLSLINCTYESQLSLLSTYHNKLSLLSTYETQLSLLSTHEAKSDKLSTFEKHSDKKFTFTFKT